MYGGVILHSGEFAVSEIDLQIPGRGFDFAFRRTYRSQVVYSGVLGWGWDHTYNRRILKMPGGDLLYYDGSGRRERFKAKKSGDTITGYEAPKGFFVKVKKYEDGTIKLLHSDRFLEVFDSSGRLIELEDRNENRMEFFYNINGQLSTIVDTMERKFRLEYFPFEDAEGERMVDYKSGRIKSISDFSGRKVTYTYKEGSGDLEKVDFAGRVKEYTYSTDAKDIKLAHNLLTYTDPEGQQVVSVSYDTEKQDKVISIDRGGSSTSFACGGSASVTDGSGNSKTFIHNDKGNPTSIGAGGYSTTFSTNDDGLITDVTYPEGNSVSYTYGGSDEDKRSKGNLISIQENPGWRGSSDPDEFTRTTTFSYENYFNQVTSVSTPGGLSISNSDQDEQGNFRQVSTNIPGISYNYSYTEHGRLQSETGPFGLTGNYSYGNNGKGYLEQISSSYENESLSSDEVGNLTGYSSSRGVSSSYSVNEHGEVTSESTTASGSISPLSYSGNYTYNKNGLVTAASTSYGTGAGIIQNSSSYTYDRRYNLLSESESSRGTTSYAYDNNDNVTSISGPLSTVSFNYNSRDLISSMTTGGGTGGRTYSFSYDGNANMVSATDPYGHYTAYEYDGFDRLRRTIDPLSNETVLARGNFGNLL
ncbi:MAG: RHS repeat protein, partial [Candidatus Aminicenantes bacterium]|nr:RHS repeat protein [Candidatus Aminicenantes bacterium]